jgi:SpoVK/Ycf46/Vps4 family AAA+-type ATPase
LAKALAEEVPVFFQSVRGYDLLTRPTEEAAYFVVRLADRAISKAPAIVFIDDLDRILHRSQAGDAPDGRLTYAVVSAVDKLLAHPDIVVIGAVRDFASVPPFLRAARRLAHSLEIRAPSIEQKVEIVQAITRSIMPTKQAIDFIANDDSLASGADIRMRIDTAILDQLSALLENQKGADNSLTIDQIRAIVIDPDNKRGALSKARSGPFSPAARLAELDLNSPAGDPFAIHQPSLAPIPPPDMTSDDGIVQRSPEQQSQPDVFPVVSPLSVAPQSSDRLSFALASSEPMSLPQASKGAILSRVSRSSDPERRSKKPDANDIPRWRTSLPRSSTPGKKRGNDPFAPVGKQ